MKPDLKQRAPRGPRTCLGGFVLLPRMLDKCRAELAGTSGEYHYNCPMDQHFFNFTGIDAAALKLEIAKGIGDGEALAWVMANLRRQIHPWEIAQWSKYQNNRSPEDNETREFFNGRIVESGGAAREDIATWFDYLDLDDFTTFGGKA